MLRLQLEARNSSEWTFGQAHSGLAGGHGGIVIHGADQFTVGHSSIATRNLAGKADNRGFRRSALASGENHRHFSFIDGQGGRHTADGVQQQILGFIHLLFRDVFIPGIFGKPGKITDNILAAQSHVLPPIL
jgi:hypothetical protein